MYEEHYKIITKYWTDNFNATPFERNLITLQQQTIDVYYRRKEIENGIIEYVLGNKIKTFDELNDIIKVRIEKNSSSYKLVNEVTFVIFNTLGSWNEGLLSEKTKSLPNSFDRFKNTLIDSDIYKSLDEQGIGLILFDLLTDKNDILINIRKKEIDHYSHYLLELRNIKPTKRSNAIIAIRHHKIKRFIPQIVELYKNEEYEKVISGIFDAFNDFLDEVKKHIKKIIEYSKTKNNFQNKSRFLELLGKVGGIHSNKELTSVINSTNETNEIKSLAIRSLIKTKSEEGINEVLNFLEKELDKEHPDLDIIDRIIININHYDISNKLMDKKRQLFKDIIERSLSSNSISHIIRYSGNVRDKKIVPILIENYPIIIDIIPNSIDFQEYNVLYKNLVLIGIDEIIKATKYENIILQTNAANILGKIKEENYFDNEREEKKIVDSLIVLLNNDNYDIRDEAAQALGKFGKIALAAKQKLIELYDNDENDLVRDIAGGSLTQIGLACGFSSLNDFIRRKTRNQIHQNDVEIFIKNEYFEGPIYPQILNELNICYTNQLNISVFFLARKLLENYIIDILRINYPDEKELWLAEKKKDDIRIKSLYILIRNLCQMNVLLTKANTSSNKATRKEFKDKLERIRKLTNLTVHSIASLPQESDIKELKQLLNWVFPFLYRMKI